jgi:hypothetical protein
VSCPEFIWLQTPELINLVALSLFLPELWVGLVGPVLVGLPLPVFLQAGDHHDHRYLAEQAGDQYHHYLSQSLEKPPGGHHRHSILVIITIAE